jgi:exosortase D (VPLPA-CTERM-specific)
MKTMSLARSYAAWYGALYGLLFAIMYFPAYSWLVGHDWAREDYNYCYLVPFVVLYLIWEKKSEWIKEPSARSWSGLFVLLPGILLYWVGELAGEYFSLYISSWLVVAGLLWTHAGWKKLRVMVFPLFVSLFLFPLPNFINTKLTFSLKLISSELGIKGIQLCGMSAYREGNIIDLGFTRLQVVDACSGLRYLIPLFLMGILMSYFYRAAIWKKVIIVFSTIPLAIVTNSLRIALTAVLYQSIGPAAAEGFFHDFSGWVIFMVSFGVILAEIWILGKILPGPDESFFKKTTAEGVDGEKYGKSGKGDPALETKDSRAFLTQPQFILAAAVLAITVVVHSVVDFREKHPSSRPFNQFPVVVGGWEGKRQVIDQQLLDALQCSDYTNINYSKIDGRPVNIYVAYYESQRKGRSIHSPETCLPGSGWYFKQAGTVTIPLSGKTSSSLTVMRALMEKGDTRNLVYFWFNQRGRILTNAYEMKFYNLYDALIKKRTDGALVRIITPIASSEKIDDADKRLHLFLKDIIPTLDEFIPGQAVQ